LKNFGEFRLLQYAQATDFSGCSGLETTMNKKVLTIGGIAATAVLAGGWALAQTAGHGPGGFGPPFMQGHGGGPGMMQHEEGMGPGMMGKGMMHKGGGMGPGMMHGGAGTTQFDPERLATLKTELSITTAQETAWSKYAKAVEDAATAMSATRAGIDPNTVRNMTPQDRFAYVTKIREQAQTQFTAVQRAANELFTVLDETQKAKARTTLPGLAFGPGPMHGAAEGQQHQH
jgi:hypothetical protein